MRESGSRRLMANPRGGDKCASATAAMRGFGAPRRQLPCPAQRSGVDRDRGDDRPFPQELTRWREINSLWRAPAAFLHSDRNFLRSLPWRPLVSASLEHSSDAARARLFGLLRRWSRCRRRGGRRGVCARRSPSGAGMRRRSRPRGKKVSSWKHLGLKRDATSRRDAEPWMNEVDWIAFSAITIFCQILHCFDRSPLSRAVAALGWGLLRFAMPQGDQG